MSGGWSLLCQPNSCFSMYRPAKALLLICLHLAQVPGLVNVDFADVRTVMAGSGSALMGQGQASGKNRAKDAALAAISSPLLDVGIERATGIVWNITGPPDLTLWEVPPHAEPMAGPGVDAGSFVVHAAARLLLLCTIFLLETFLRGPLTVISSEHRLACTTYLHALGHDILLAISRLPAKPGAGQDAPLQHSTSRPDLGCMKLTDGVGCRILPGAYTGG